MPVDVDAARSLALTALEGVDRRAEHSAAVAAAAARARHAVAPQDRDLLVAAAWLHDIGYAATASGTGFHPVDGADLLARLGWPARLVALVAHHSEARFAARATGLEPALDRYPRERGPVPDALAYADMSVAPDGRHTTLHERLADIRRRHCHEPAHLAQARASREPHLVLAVARTEVRLLRAGAVTALALPLRGPRPSSQPAVAAGLARRHPGRPLLDVVAALHAATSRLQCCGTACGAGSGRAALADELLAATALEGRAAAPLWSA